MKTFYIKQTKETKKLVIHPAKRHLLMHMPIKLIFTVCFLASIFSCDAAGNQEKPDILLIMPDQFRGDCLSVLGHPAVHTPTLDGLARQGVLFRRAYSTCPSCIPARHSLLTGLFPQTSGVVGYAGRPIKVPTLPKLLGEAGYTCLLVGRNMHQVPTNQLYGFQTQIRGSTYIPDDDYDLFLKQSASEAGGIRALVDRLGLSNNGWAAKPWPLAEELHPTSWIVARARKAVSDVPDDKPLFLTASFYAPHPPLFPPKRLFSEYLHQSLPRPARGDWVDWKSLLPGGDKAGHRVLLAGDTLRATQAGYFGLIQHLDEQVSPLIAEFKDRSRRLKRPWLIAFTSDHGEMLGDHGFFRKCEPYEGSANIPVIVAASPELSFGQGLRCQQPVCLEDLMPTLLQLAGASCPRIDGVSLIPALRGQPDSIRQQLHLEHAVCYSKEQAFQALTDGHYKYIWRPETGAEQLFNLDKDPLENHDLSAGAEMQLLKQWREKMVKQLAGRPEGFSDGVKLIAGRPYPPLQARE